ncbi:hypothetical protein [Cupriavidus sp. TMH.W2]|uniref:hypothetical protein n=1 Tax=Cupriavidus sp. TMH.W2 TaxID=3434465 RepID=UPI003D773DE4
MEFGLNITLDDDATAQDVAEAIQFAALHAAAALSDRGQHISVDGQIDFELAKGKLQNATINRYD